MSKSIPSQYKKLADECINDIMKAADRLYPIITELGDSLTITNNKSNIIVFYL